MKKNLGEMDMRIAVRKLREDAVLPARGSAEAAGADLRACMDEERIELAPGETKLIGTGLSMAVPSGISAESLHAPGSR